MMAARRFLPSTSALMCFEAVARLGSATEAAQELALTQSAVSRQLKTLSTQLGVALFERRGRRLILTSRGETYLTDVREILQHLTRASVALSTDAEGTTFNLSILPAFGMHWLAPRLADFAKRHPEVTVNLSTRLAPFDFRTTRFDAAIHFGRADWPTAHHLRLASETVVPVCAPNLIAGPLEDPTRLLGYDLLHLETRPKGWVRWLQAFEIDAPRQPGMVFDQFSTMAQAALHGLGIALLPTFVAKPYLDNGQLVLASSHTTQSIGDYYLVWPKQARDGRALTAFRTWLCQQTGGPDAHDAAFP